MSTFIDKDKTAKMLLMAINEVKGLIKGYEKRVEEYTQQLYNIVSEHEQIISDDGEELATWKYSKDTEYFDSKTLKEDNSDIYNAYLKTRPGARVLRIK